MLGEVFASLGFWLFPGKRNLCTEPDFFEGLGGALLQIEDPRQVPVSLRRCRRIGCENLLTNRQRFTQFGFRLGVLLLLDMGQTQARERQSNFWMLGGLRFPANGQRFDKTFFGLLIFSLIEEVCCKLANCAGDFRVIGTLHFLADGQRLLQQLLRGCKLVAFGIKFKRPSEILQTCCDGRIIRLQTARANFKSAIKQWDGLVRPLAHFVEFAKIGQGVGNSWVVRL